VRKELFEIFDNDDGVEEEGEEKDAIFACWRLLLDRTPVSSTSRPNNIDQLCLMVKLLSATPRTTLMCRASILHPM
jgi:hypothetical protein